MRKSLLFFVFAITLPIAAVAQSPANPIDEIRQNARAHVGPVYLTPRFELKELGVDSNVFNEPGEQKSDFTFTAAPDVALWLPIARRALITTSVRGDFVYYAKYATERSIDPGVNARGDLFLHRLTLFAETGFLHTRQRPNFEIDARSRRQEKNLTAGAAYRITPKFSIEAAAVRGTVDFDGDEFFLGTRLRDALNRTSTAYSLTARHGLTALTSLSLRVEEFEDEFEFSTQRDTRNLRVLSGFDFRPRALVNGTAHVGFRRLAPKINSVVPDYTGLVADLGLSYTLLGSTTFGARLERDVMYSFEPLEPYFVSTSAGASIRRALSRWFDLLVSADRHRSAYRDLPNGVVPAGTAALAPPLDRGARIDTTWAYEASVGYRVTRTTRLGAGVWYSERRSTRRTLHDYHNFRIRATVTSRF